MARTVADPIEGGYLDMGWVEIAACERSWSVVFRGHRMKSLEKAEVERNGLGNRRRSTSCARSEVAMIPTRESERMEEKGVVRQRTISLGCAENCPNDGGHLMMTSQWGHGGVMR